MSGFGLTSTVLTLCQTQSVYATHLEGGGGRLCNICHLRTHTSWPTSYHERRMQCKRHQQWELHIISAIFRLVSKILVK